MILLEEQAGTISMVLLSIILLFNYLIGFSCALYLLFSNGLREATDEVGVGGQVYTFNNLCGLQST